MIKFTDLMGMTQATLKEAMQETDQMVGLTQKESLDKDSLKKMVRSEYNKLCYEIAETYPTTQKKLEEIRKSVFKEYFKRQKVGNTFEAVLEKRIQLQTVSELTEIPVNNLMLYFLNEVKGTSDRQLVEYRMGHVYFYAN